MSQKGPSEKYLPNQETLLKWTEGTLLESLAKHIDSSSQTPLPIELKENGLTLLAFLHTPLESKTSYNAFCLSWNSFKETKTSKHRQAEIAVRLMGTKTCSSLKPPPHMMNA